MRELNPYSAPESNVEVDRDVEFDARMKKMAMGQKLVIYAVLLYFGSVGLRLVIGPYAAILLIFSLIVSLVGLYKVLSARKSHILLKVTLFILLFIPLVNILVLLRINAVATKTLRAAGYKVGFMGASK